MNLRMRKFLISLLSVICLLTFASTAVYAYFKTDLRVNGFANVKIELLFDKLNSAALEQYQSTLVDANGKSLVKGNKADSTGDYKWGHKANPYVISLTRHLHNLSVLQNIGYFNKNHLKNNYEGDKLLGNAEYYDGYDVPYFLISTQEGNPVIIDGTKEHLEPVGNDEFPFIGSIKGVSGTVAEGNIFGKTTTTSAIHGVNIEGKSSALDYGFFGKISYLGQEPANVEGQTTPTSFKGFSSTLENVLFSDIKIKVVNTIWDDIKAFFTSHKFNKDLPNAVTEKDPAENHHIGLVAGHVEYTTMKNISVYYSSEKIMAVDLSDTMPFNGMTPNYSSATGHIGFIYRLNPTVDGNNITIGTGVDSSDISSGFEGGGGADPGSLPGYVFADKFYEMFRYYNMGTANAPDIQQQTGDLQVIRATDETGTPLVNEVSNLTSTNYYFSNNIFTFALSSGQKLSDEATLDTIEDVWKNHVPDKISLSSNGWEIGPKGSHSYFYKELEMVDVPRKPDGTPKVDKQGNTLEPTCFSEPNNVYYIGTFDANGSFHFMNLKSKGTSVPASVSVGHLKENSNIKTNVGLQYNNANERKQDESFYIKAKRTKFINADGQEQNSLKFYLASNAKNQLGIRKDIIIGLNQIVCDNKKDSFLFQYAYDFVIVPVEQTVNGMKVTSWEMKAYSANWGKFINIGFNGNDQFSLELFGSGAAQPIYIYRVVGNNDGIVEENFAYKPKAEAFSLDANKCVLWPMQQVSGAEKKTNTTYEVLPLTNSKLKWIDENGKSVWSTDENGVPVINKMFSMKRAVKWSVAGSIGGLGLDLGSEGSLIKAIVGKTSTAYIPTGSVAFRVNKVPSKGVRIRVVVKVPTGYQKWQLGADSDSASNDHYLGVWKGKESTGGFIELSSFNQNDAIAKVELPRSQPLIESNQRVPSINGNGASSDNEFLNVVYNGNNYTTMLQGENILMAYEFNVKQTGIYIIAATENIPMQIAYCMADGIASEGRDGTSGAPTSSIDFVYHSNITNKILLVTDIDDRPADSITPGNEEDVDNYYYQSYCLVYLCNVEADGTKNIVNSEKITIYRVNDGTGKPKTSLNVIVVSADEFVRCESTAPLHDNIVLKYTKPTA